MLTAELRIRRVLSTIPLRVPIRINGEFVIEGERQEDILEQFDNESGWNAVNIVIDDRRGQREQKR